MKKLTKRILSAGSIIAGLALLAGLGQYIYRQYPREIPPDSAKLHDAACAIIQDKCISCHSSSNKAPFYANFPGIASVIQEHLKQGNLRWDFTRLISESGNHRLPISALNKLEEVVSQSHPMPPAAFQLMHPGTNLSESEREILTRWIKQQRASWLEPLGLQDYAHLPVQPLPDSLPTNPDMADLGRALYHDVRLSGANTISCASCHALDKAGTDNLPVSPGDKGQLGGINAPTSFNAVFHTRQFWDGRAASLQDQAAGPPLNPGEMNSASWDEIIAKLNQDADFTAKFNKVFPEGYSGATITQAIAEFEKTLVTPNSRFDKFLKGDKSALNSQELAGYKLFTEAGCATCHAGPAMGGQSFEFLGLNSDYFAHRGTPLTDADTGRAAFTRNDADKHKFKVPTLRNVALTGPWLHDASAKSLADAVKLMFEFQTSYKNPSQQDIADVTAFLETLTGELYGKPLTPTPSSPQNTPTPSPSAN